MSYEKNNRNHNVSIFGGCSEYNDIYGNGKANIQEGKTRRINCKIYEVYRKERI